MRASCGRMKPRRGPHPDDSAGTSSAGPAQVVAVRQT
jgi:hypothetical protein